MALRHFVLERRQHLTHRRIGLLAHLRIDPRFRRLGRLLRRQATRAAQFVGPHRHRRQRRLHVFRRGHRLRQRALKSVPDHQQLRARRLQQGREFQVDAAPVGIGLQRCGLLLPMCDVFAQRPPHRLRRAPGFGRQHLDTLGEQDCRLALHLHRVLQVLNHPNAFGQLRLEREQRLPAQGRAGLGRITLPCQRVGNVELGLGQKGLGLGGPLRCNLLLILGAPDLVQALTDRPGCALVARGEFAKDFLQLLVAGVLRQPCPHAGGAFPGGRRTEGAIGPCVEFLDVCVLGAGGHRDDRFKTGGRARQSGIFASKTAVNTDRRTKLCRYCN